jgi:glycine oxidase
MSGGPKVIVEGAGALGLVSALALADAGCRVTVCDPAPPGANASAVAAGMLAPAFEAVLDVEAAPHFGLLLAARDLWPELAARAGVAVDRSGAVAVGSEAWLGSVRAGLTRLGLHGTDLPRRTLEDLAPGIAEGFAEGLMTREDWRLEPVAALAALRAAAEAAGVSFRAEPANGPSGADWLVAATGAAGDLAPELAGLTPIKGHILRTQAAGGGRVSVRGEGVYAAPSAEGLAIGATMELGVSDPTVDPAQGAALRAAGARLFPAVARAPFELQAGVRAASPDGLPLVGASSEPKVLLAAGARRNGWLLAPMVARLIAACVAGRDLGPYAARLDPARFS